MLFLKFLRYLSKSRLDLKLIIGGTVATVGYAASLLGLQVVYMAGTWSTQSYTAGTQSTAGTSATSGLHAGWYSVYDCALLLVLGLWTVQKGTGATEQRNKIHSIQGTDIQLAFCQVGG